MAEGEKRSAPRQRVLKAAKIITMDNTSVIDCTVRNQSETGALLVVEKNVTVPDEFQFFLANGDTVRDAVVKSDQRVPTPMTRSASRASTFAAVVPVDPTAPTSWG